MRLSQEKKEESSKFCNIDHFILRMEVVEYNNDNHIAKDQQPDILYIICNKKVISSSMNKFSFCNFSLCKRQKFSQYMRKKNEEKLIPEFFFDDSH